MKKAVVKRLTVIAMVAAIAGTTVVPVVSNTTTVEAATKKAKKAKLKKARFKASAVSLSDAGNVIWVSGVKIASQKKVTVTINGKKAGIDHLYQWDNDGQWITQIYLKSALDTGTHKIQVQEKGYKAVTKTVQYESIADKFVVYDPVVTNEQNDGKWVAVCLNPNVDAQKVKCTIDGTEVQPLWSNINGDGVLLISYDASKLDEGDHSITISCEGYETYTGTFSGKVEA